MKKMSMIMVMSLFILQVAASSAFAASNIPQSSTDWNDRFSWNYYNPVGGN